MIRYLSVEQVVSLHQHIVGHLTDAGVRDFRGLEKAVGRPAVTFETLDAKAAVLLHGLVTMAPFADAGRETALLATECFLIANGATWHATDRDLERLGDAVASGEMSVDTLAIWIRQRRGVRT